MVRIFLGLLTGNFLREIFGPVLENGFWRRCKDSEIHKLCDEYNVVKFVKIGRIRRAGNVMRKEESDSASY
jgi:hypothetical protein